MEHSHSETSSDEEVLTITRRELEEVTQNIRLLSDNLNWHAAILAVLLEEAGGVVQLKRDDLDGIDLATAKATIAYDEATETYTIERLQPDES